VKSLPKLDRESLRQAMHEDMEKLVEEVVAGAVDGAAPGRLIRDSEHPVRHAVGHFRQRVYQEAMQTKVKAAEAAFPPSAECGNRETPA
jgi:hypothetical protein